MPPVTSSDKNVVDKTVAPQVRLAHVPGAQGDNTLLGRNGVAKLPEELYPAILISYYYLEKFLDKQTQYGYRDWMMDSGAFSAYNLGKSIDLHKYMDMCHRLRENDKTLKEIIALDVIGSGEGSLKNAYTMKENGIKAMPVFHIGDDWQILVEYAEHWDKIGISCRFGEPLKESYKFYEQCFARIWPKKTHSFGWIDEKMLMTFPLHSCDSTTWEIGACRFGRYQYFGKLPIRGSSQDLRTQVEWYLELERKLQNRWKKEMLLLESLPSVF